MIILLTSYQPVFTHIVESGFKVAWKIQSFFNCVQLKNQNSITKKSKEPLIVK
jgi:hypothetical protein